MALRKRSSADERGPSELKIVDDDGFYARWPHVFDFLAQTKWDDGTDRQVGSVTLFVEDGRPKVCLSDKDADEVCFVTGGGFLEALDAAEAGLRGEALDWRQSKARRR